MYVCPFLAHMMLGGGWASTVHRRVRYGGVAGSLRLRVRVRRLEPLGKVMLTLLETVEEKGKEGEGGGRKEGEGRRKRGRKEREEGGGRGEGKGGRGRKEGGRRGRKGGREGGEGRRGRKEGKEGEGGE